MRHPYTRPGQICRLCYEDQHGKALLGRSIRQRPRKQHKEAVSEVWCLVALAVLAYIIYVMAAML